MKSSTKHRTQAKTLKKVRLSALRLDFQPAENLLEDVVTGYVELLRSGKPILPVCVRFDGVNYFLEDGFHRAEAAKRAGLQEIDAEIAPGSLADMESEFKEYVKALRKSLTPDSGTFARKRPRKG